MLLAVGRVVRLGCCFVGAILSGWGTWTRLPGTVASRRGGHPMGGSWRVDPVVARQAAWPRGQLLTARRGRVARGVALLGRGIGFVSSLVIGAGTTAALWALSACTRTYDLIVAVSPLVVKGRGWGWI